jgi:predicted metalloprotease with PDZ domain
MPKLIYAFILYTLCCFVQAKEILPEVKYAVSIQKTDNNIFLVVKLKCPTDKYGATFLVYPNETWGQSKLHNTIVSLKCITPNSTAELDNGNGQINVKHPMGIAEIEIEYILKQDFSDSISARNYYRPIIQNNYFHLLGHSLLAFPAQLKSDFVSIEIKWHKSINSPINSFGAKKSKQKFVSNYNALTTSVFCSGDFKIKRYKIFDANLYVAHRGTWTQMDDSTFNGMVYRTVVSQRKFWKDNDQKYFFISAIPLAGKIVKDANGNIKSCNTSAGGTCLTNSFASFFTNNECLPKYKFYYIFNHELMHNWIGINGIPLPAENEELAYWFSEGFTDYFAYKNMVKNNFMSFKTFESEVQKEVVQPHYASTVKEMPNDSIKGNFWSNVEYQKLPYRRGFLIAWYMDIAIRKKTNNFKSLDDFIKDMASSCKSTKEKFNLPKFQRMFDHFMNEEDMSAFVNLHIIQGKVLDLENSIVWPGIKWIHPSDGNDLILQVDENNAELRRFFFE